MSDQDFRVAVIVVSAIVAILLIVVALPVVLSMRHAARDRAFQHAERLKALEMGRPLPSDQPTEPQRVAGSGLGIWVPLGSLSLALAATRTSVESVAIASWAAAGSVGVAAVICGTILAARAPKPARAPERSSYVTKTHAGEDEFDVVSRRG